MRISLFENKSDNEKAPKMKGFLKVDQELKDLIQNAALDTDLEIAVWNTTSKSGNNYLGGKVSKPMEKKEYKGNPSNTVTNNDLPF